MLTQKAPGPLHHDQFYIAIWRKLQQLPARQKTTADFCA